MDVYNTEINYCIEVRGGTTFHLLPRDRVCGRGRVFIYFFSKAACVKRCLCTTLIYV